MTTTLEYSSDVAFTPTVKAIQTRKGSRRGYAAMENRGGWRTRISSDLAAFITEQRSIFFATANAAGQPYIQHRGGPAGFLKVLDDRTIAFADLRGNRQYITQGNLAENPKAHIFVMDYANLRRLKLWGTARVVEGDDALNERLMPASSEAHPEQTIIFTVEALDLNCPQHIPRRLDFEDVQRVLGEREVRIEALEADLAALRQKFGVSAAEAGASDSAGPSRADHLRK